MPPVLVKNHTLARPDVTKRLGGKKMKIPKKTQSQLNISETIWKVIFSPSTDDHIKKTWKLQ